MSKAFLSIKNVHIDERVERIKIPHILMTITFLENTALIFFLHLHFKYLATSMLSLSLHYQLSTLLESHFPSTLSIQQSYILSQLLWPKWRYSNFPVIWSKFFHFHLNKGLTLIMSALETLYGSQLMLSTHLIIKLSCNTPPMQHHNFFRN